MLAGDALGSIDAVEEFARNDVGVDAVLARRTFLYRVDEAGLIQECWVLDEDQTLMDRLWS